MVKNYVTENLLLNFIVRMEEVTVHEDGTVDVDGDVQVSRNHMPWHKLPVRFGKVKGSFMMAQQPQLETLEGCPSECWEFYVGLRDKGPLTNLLHSPRIVHNKFVIDAWSLTSLEGCPEQIEGYISIPVPKPMGLLRTLVAKRGFHSKFDDRYMSWKVYQKVQEAQEIINKEKWQGKGKLGAIPCAAELIRAGLSEYAKW